MAAIVAANIENRRAVRIFRDRASLADMRDADILTRYRLDRDGINYLVDLLRYDLEKGTRRSKSIPVLTQVKRPLV